MVQHKKYEIRIPHYYCLEYIEDDKKMTLDIDFRDTIIYLSTDLIGKWDSTHSDEIVSKQKKEEILKSINEYLINVRGFTNIKLEM